MARQSHSVVTKHRGWHCLVCEEIVVPDRSNLSPDRVGPLSSRVFENKDHSALIAPSRSNRGSPGIETTLRFLFLLRFPVLSQTPFIHLFSSFSFFFLVVHFFLVFYLLRLRLRNRARVLGFVDQPRYAMGIKYRSPLDPHK